LENKSRNNALHASHTVGIDKDADQIFDLLILIQHIASRTAYKYARFLFCQLPHHHRLEFKQVIRRCHIAFQGRLSEHICLLRASQTVKQVVSRFLIR